LPVSWDLYLVPREHAEDHEEWLESLVVDEVPADGEAAEEHARAVVARRPELESSGPGDDGTVELTAPEESGLPFQVLLDGRHASIGIAYWDLGERQDELAGMLADVVSALQERTGWLAFDPQEGREVGIEELRRLFADGHATGVGLVQEIGREEPPRRRRFLGLF
jgi:hypothetical protein